MGKHDTPVSSKKRNYTQNNKKIYDDSAMQLTISGVCQAKQNGALILVYDYGFYRLDGHVLDAIMDDNGRVRRMSVIDELDFNGVPLPEELDEFNAMPAREIPLLSLNQKNAGDADIKLNSLPVCEFDDLYQDQVLLDKWQRVLSEENLDERQIYLLTKSGDAIKHTMSRIKSSTTEIDALVDETLTSLNYAENVEMVKDSDRFITLSRTGNPYNAFSEVLWRHKGKWYQFYSAGQSSKGITEIQALQQLSDSQLSFELCIKGCDWWGVYETILFDWEMQAVE